jgi:hypothetical protein
VQLKEGERHKNKGNIRNSSNGYVSKDSGKFII